MVQAGSRYLPEAESRPLKMQRYQFTARWVRGKENLDNDALARAPVDIATPADEMTEEIPSSATRSYSYKKRENGRDEGNTSDVFREIKTPKTVCLSGGWLVKT
ncbi:hypothetical protein DAPPUDRAFT_256521 [Daphnia pulex]|uniref:Uncharacterized protein n=1 Tax=Daphnia pulex TaxID=6669 RepID=E9HBJ7_DAPPU|nr:hypothetical protein DAPPUDRAFT_256521 [Daphnia pulex]|eukprot:EFX70853.1 hypothetical protein DAPPUDRAFT_256521 [Daphnia pulex]